MTAISTIRMRDFVDAAKYMHPKQTILLRGRHGIGKSQIVYELAKVWGLDTVIERRVAQLSEGDMIGLPDRDATKVYNFDGENKEIRVTSFLPTDWFTLAETKPCLIFLDEINRGLHEVQQAAFQFVESGELNGRKIHPQSRIVAAVNFSKEYNVTPMGFAFLDRFAIFDLEPDKKDWIDWARRERIAVEGDSYNQALRNACKTNIHPLIIDFINQCNSPHFEIMPEDQAKLDPHEITPSRRSWERLSKVLVLSMDENLQPLIKNVTNDSFYHVCRSLVGPDAAQALLKFAKVNSNKVTPEVCLKDFDSIKSHIEAMTAEEQVTFVDKVVYYIEQNKENKFTEEQGINLGKLFRTLPDEISMGLWNKLSNNNAERAKVLYKYIAKDFLRMIASTKIGDQLPELRAKAGLPPLKTDSNS